MMGDLAKGMKQFKAGMADEDYDRQLRYDEHRRSEPPRLPREQDPIDVTARRDEQARTTRDDEIR